MARFNLERVLLWSKLISINLASVLMVLAIVGVIVGAALGISVLNELGTEDPVPPAAEWGY